jgi:hypothetical protein
MAWRRLVGTSRRDKPRPNLHCRTSGCSSIAANSIVLSTANSVSRGAPIFEAVGKLAGAVDVSTIGVDVSLATPGPQAELVNDLTWDKPLAMLTERHI